MPSKIEIQVLTPLTKAELTALRDEIRNIEGFGAFDLKIPPAPAKEGTMGPLEELILHGLIGGVCHFLGEKGIEFFQHKMKGIISKFNSSRSTINPGGAEKMGGKGIEVIIAEQESTSKDPRSKKTIYLNAAGAEKIISNREYSINPERTHAILIGISKYDDEINFKEIPPVVGNLDEMQHVFIDKRYMGLPMENIHKLPNQTSVSILKKLNEVSRIPGIETLIIYYAGHGQDIGNNKLSLIAKDTHNIDERLHSAIAYEEIERVIKSSPAAQKIIILDACHSGLAAQGSNINQYDFDPVVGTYTLTSTSADEASYYKKQNNYTYFTGYIIKLFTEGIRNANNMLSLNDFYRYTSEQLEKDNLPLPNRKYEIKTVAEGNFFISNNPGFDLDAKLKRPDELYEAGKIEEARAEYLKLLDEYPENTDLEKRYIAFEKSFAITKLIDEGDSLYYETKNYALACDKYEQANRLKNDEGIKQKILACRRRLQGIDNVNSLAGINSSMLTEPGSSASKAVLQDEKLLKSASNSDQQTGIEDADKLSSSNPDDGETAIALKDAVPEPVVDITNKERNKRFMVYAVLCGFLSLIGYIYNLRFYSESGNTLIIFSALTAISFSISLARLKNNIPARKQIFFSIICIIGWYMASFIFFYSSNHFTMLTFLAGCFYATGIFIFYKLLINKNTDLKIGVLYSILSGLISVLLAHIIVNWLTGYYFEKEILFIYRNDYASLVSLNVFSLFSVFYPALLMFSILNANMVYKNSRKNNHGLTGSK